MSDLISRQAAIDAIKRYESADSYDLNNGLIIAMNAVADVPTIDPVKHGEWIPNPFIPDRIVCSVCRNGTQKRYHYNVGVYGGYDVEEGRAYCPNCGAKMDVADNDVGKMCEVSDERTD